MWEAVKWIKSVKQHGSLARAIKNFWISSDVKQGTLVGTDKLGNKYFQNTSEIVWGRDRWVEYSESEQGGVYPKESSQVQPEWNAWMHRMTDAVPGTKEAEIYFAKVSPEFVQPVHYGNLTGTEKAYRPYDTTRPKIESWTGPAQ